MPKVPKVPSNNPLPAYGPTVPIEPDALVSFFGALERELFHLTRWTLEGSSNSLTEIWLDNLMLEQSNQSKLKT